jgi:hypothetical protein
LATSLQKGGVMNFKLIQQALVALEMYRECTPEGTGVAEQAIVALKQFKKEWQETEVPYVVVECNCSDKTTLYSPPQPKQEQGEPVAWRYKPVREDNPRWEYTTQHPLDMGDGYLRPSLVEYCKCIEPLYATEKPKLMLEKFREMKDLLEDTVRQEPATKEQIREALVFNLPLYTHPYVPTERQPKR